MASRRAFIFGGTAVFATLAAESLIAHTVFAPPTPENLRISAINLDHLGLAPFVPTYLEQAQYVSDYGVAPYKRIHQDLYAIAQLMSSARDKVPYIDRWGSNAKEKIQAAQNKIDTFELSGFENNAYMKSVLKAVATVYPGLIIACPSKIGRGSPQAGGGQKDWPHVEDDRFVVFEVLENEEPEEKIYRIGVLLHEMSHYFGGDFVNRNVLQKIGPYAKKEDFISLIQWASKAAESDFKYWSMNPQHPIFATALKLNSSGVSSLNEADMKILTDFLVNGHFITLGQFDMDVNATPPEDPELATEAARIKAAKALFSLITPNGMYDSSDSYPEGKVYDLVMQGNV